MCTVIDPSSGVKFTELPRVVRQFRQCSFMEAMQSLHTSKRIRTVSTRRGFYFKVSDSGVVKMYNEEDIYLCDDIVITSTQEHWEVEA